MKGHLCRVDSGGQACRQHLSCVTVLWPPTFQGAGVAPDTYGLLVALEGWAGPQSSLGGRRSWRPTEWKGDVT